MRVAVVMPPATDWSPADAVDRWGTVTHAAAAVLAGGRATPTVHCRHESRSEVVSRGGIEYHFHSSDASLAAAVAVSSPDVVHVHGLGWSRLVRRLHRAAPRVPIVLQHHGEQPFVGRARLGHRLVRRHVAAYLFTGASTGQAQPWIDAGVIAPEARCREVLEAGSLLPAGDGTTVALEGAPAVLWVGRLNEGKDPLTAVEAFVSAAPTLPEAHLHVLATERTLEPRVRVRMGELGALSARIHLHEPVAHEHMASWYRAAHVYFSTSRHEGSNYSLIEALTCGCVPAVTAIPPHLAIVGGLGATFPPGDVARAAMSLATCSTMPREPIAAASRTIVSWGKVAEQLVDAYDSVVRTGHRDWTGRR